MFSLLSTSQEEEDHTGPGPLRRRVGYLHSSPRPPSFGLGRLQSKLAGGQFSGLGADSVCGCRDCLLQLIGNVASLFPQDTRFSHPGE